MRGRSTEKQQSVAAGAVVVSWSRSLLLGVLAIAPWAYGCTRWWVLPWFSGALTVCLTLWIIGLVLRQRPLVGSRWVIAAAVLLVAQGWLMVANAAYRYDREELRFIPVRPWFASWLPSAIDSVDAFPMVLRVTGLLGALLISLDAARHASWRRQIFWTIALTGTALALYGLIQRASPVPLLFWESADLSHNLFATFYYHGNAGAFMNLVLPFVFGTAVDGFAPNRRPMIRAFGISALFLNLAAAVAIASKAAQFVTLALLFTLLFAYRKELLLFSGLRSSGRGTKFIAVAIGLLCIGALALTADTARQRWAMLPKNLDVQNPRLLSYQVCLRMLPDAGIWGIGPGNFAIAFPHYTHDLPDAIRGIWSYAHEDYLQTVIEWGWVGTAGWTIILIGGLMTGWNRQRNVDPSAISTVESSLVYRSGTLAIFGVALHATVDFPLQIASIQLYAVTILGVLWCPITVREGRHPDELRTPTADVRAPRRTRSQR